MQFASAKVYNRHTQELLSKMAGSLTVLFLYTAGGEVGSAEGDEMWSFGSTVPSSRATKKAIDLRQELAITGISLPNILSWDLVFQPFTTMKPQEANVADPGAKAVLLPFDMLSVPSLPGSLECHQHPAICLPSPQKFDCRPTSSLAVCKCFSCSC